MAAFLEIVSAYFSERRSSAVTDSWQEFKMRFNQQSIGLVKGQSF
jgi:hypothetical protein